eukprot:COSAG01_NODE_710_length_14110_cov_94.506745_2_plen_419_part_00
MWAAGRCTAGRCTGRGGARGGAAAGRGRYPGAGVARAPGAAAVASFLGGRVAEIYLCNVCSDQEILRRRTGLRGQGFRAYVIAAQILQLHFRRRQRRIRRKRAVRVAAMVVKIQARWRGHVDRRLILEAISSTQVERQKAREEQFLVDGGGVDGDEPLAVDSIVDLLKRGQIDFGAAVWRRGMADWVSLRDYLATEPASGLARALRELRENPVMRVVCPADMVPGNTVVVTLPDGSQGAVSIPEGVNPGDTFDIGAASVAPCNLLLLAGISLCDVRSCHAILRAQRTRLALERDIWASDSHSSRPSSPSAAAAAATGVPDTSANAPASAETRQAAAAGATNRSSAPRDEGAARTASPGKPPAQATSTPYGSATDAPKATSGNELVPSSHADPGVDAFELELRKLEGMLLQEHDASPAG